MRIFSMRLEDELINKYKKSAKYLNTNYQTLMRTVLWNYFDNTSNQFTPTVVCNLNLMG